ncbi:MAG: hypothetical protein ACYDDC_05100 [Thermoplasmataceae archaeon]
MEMGILILFTLPSKEKKIPAREIVRMYRKLYGYNNSSDYGKYHTRVPGLLDQKRHIRYPNGAILLESGEEPEIIDFLKKNKAEVFYWKVVLSDKEKVLIEGQNK